MKKINYEVLFVEAKEISQNLKENLPEVADPATVSHFSKIPFKVLSIRELMIWRVYDLSESTIRLIENNNIVSAIIIIRAIIESVALTYYLFKKVETALEQQSIEGIDDNLMRLLMGSRLPDSHMQSINVLTLVDHISKDVPAIRQCYDDLSEFAHPNWSGCFGSYGKINEKEYKLELAKIVDVNSHPFELAVNSLLASLKTFQIYYNDLADIMPDFSQICEKSIKK